MATPYVQYGQDGLSAFDANGVRRIWLNPASILLSFFDTNGIPRCEIGNLSARGISAGGWGFRVNDASGNPLYDSTGVIDAMASLGVSQAGPGQTVTSTSFITTTPAIAITFTLQRTTRCMFYFVTTAKSTVAAKVGYARLNLVGIGFTGTQKYGGGSGAMDVTNAMGWLHCGPGSNFAALPAGTYTAQIEVSVDATGSMYFDQGVLEGFRLGG